MNLISSSLFFLLFILMLQDGVQEVDVFDSESENFILGELTIMRMSRN
jgi:hypothetical protein